MTTRPGNLVLSDLRIRRSYQLAHLAEITRRDGTVLRLTDHDRPLTLDGYTYAPALMFDLSADRREAGLRSGDQEAAGIIDGTVITTEDLRGNLYRGAEVRLRVVDWAKPWYVIGSHRRWIRTLHWTGSGCAFQMEGRAAVLERATALPAGGTWTTTCPYTLGGTGCERDISPATGFSGAGARVATVVKQRWQATFVTATWPGTFVDDEHRGGSFEWRWSAPTDTGTVTATTTSTLLTDAAAGWTANAEVGKWVRILTGAGAGVSGSAYALITANTTTTLTYSTTAAMAGFTAGQAYDICPECPNAGHVSPIVAFLEATRECTFLVRTPFAIAVGDSGIWKTGCDGLITTCGGKFADADHPANFGGDPYAPSAQQVVEPPGPA